eukprot:TRINITY_DN5175_c0_g1_i2.p1 TRINITY_DN5175_c0_g1~~TRINITY_DN5175_c0_g1_i2.p1  ORF type:complete len:309 (-),score=27.75 TRINITY_DN5175_c0_g1_i2:61-987(-)
MTEAFGLLLAVCLARPTGPRKTFICDNINIINEINSSINNRQFGQLKISPTIWITELVLEHIQSFAFPPIFEHIKGHTNNSDAKSVLNCQADNLAKSAAKSPTTPIFVFYPDMSQMEFPLNGNFQVVHNYQPIKASSENIYHRLINNKKHQWSSRPVQRFNALTNHLILSPIWKSSATNKRIFFIKLITNNISTLNRVAKFRNISQICPRCSSQTETLIHFIWDCPHNNQQQILEEITNIEAEAGLQLSKILTQKSSLQTKILILSGWWPIQISISNPKRATRILEKITNWTWHNWKTRNLHLQSRGT